MKNCFLYTYYVPGMLNEFTQLWLLITLNNIITLFGDEKTEVQQ